MPAKKFINSVVILYFAVLLSGSFAALDQWKNSSFSNPRPVIGILATEIFENGVPVSSYIPASYVKFVESGGAQVAPIFLYRKEEYLNDLFAKLNGLMLPGGDATIPGMEVCPATNNPVDSGDYARSGSHLLFLAWKANEAEDYFPVWGECLGMELMMVEAANNGGVLEKCDAWNISLPLNISPSGIGSKILRDAPAHLLGYLTELEINPHWHTCCVTPESIRRHNLESSWDLVATNEDRNGLVFSSLLEHRTYPFYGLGFHPEKTLFEWNPFDNPVHNAEVTEVAHFFARFFVNEARKNNHKFSSLEDEIKHLISQHSPTYTGIGSSFRGTAADEHFIQRYFFKLEQTQNESAN